MSDDETQLRRAQVELITTLISAAVMTWYLIPEWKRRELTLRALWAVRERLSRVAQAAGRAAMRDELSTGRRDYDVPLMLATWCEGLTRQVRQLARG